MKRYPRQNKPEAKTGFIFWALVIIIAAILFTSCSASKEVQQQYGTVEVYNGKIKFTPIESWHEFTPKSDTIFRLRTVKK